MEVTSTEVGYTQLEARDIIQGMKELQQPLTNLLTVIFMFVISLYRELKEIVMYKLRRIAFLNIILKSTELNYYYYFFNLTKESFEILKIYISMYNYSICM